MYRYKIKYGKFGAYFYDTITKLDMTLKDVLYVLNSEKSINITSNGIRKCKCGCGSSISHKHPNAKFLNKKHKDSYWNTINPRGIFSRLNPDNMTNDEYYYATTHPFSSEALGQE